LAPQQARSVSATLRATYSFTPHLTLQAYGQLFTAGISYGAPLRAAVEPGRRTVRLDELRPALAEDHPSLDSDSNQRQVGLNLNLILRWEWRTGSTFYVVYAHQSSNDIKTGVPSGLAFGAELGALSAAGVSHGDTILVKVDLLSALREEAPVIQAVQDLRRLREISAVGVRHGWGELRDRGKIWGVLGRRET